MSINSLTTLFIIKLWIERNLGWIWIAGLWLCADAIAEGFATFAVWFF